jgi:hypothetical protein
VQECLVSKLDLLKPGVGRQCNKEMKRNETPTNQKGRNKTDYYICRWFGCSQPNPQESTKRQVSSEKLQGVVPHTSQYRFCVKAFIEDKNF